jgi:hypothetical protein
MTSNYMTSPVQLGATEKGAGRGVVEASWPPGYPAHAACYTDARLSGSPQTKCRRREEQPRPQGLLGYLPTTAGLFTGVARSHRGGARKEGGGRGAAEALRPPRLPSEPYRRHLHKALNQPTSAMSCATSTKHVHDNCSSVPPPNVPSPTMRTPAAARHHGRQGHCRRGAGG